MRKTFPRQSKRRCDPQSRWARAFLAGSASAFEAPLDCIDLTDLCSTSPSFRPPIQRPVDCVADAQSGALLACIAALDDPDSKISRAVAARPAPRTMGCLSIDNRAGVELAVSHRPGVLQVTINEIVDCIPDPFRAFERAAPTFASDGPIANPAISASQDADRPVQLTVGQISVSADDRERFVSRRFPAAELLMPVQLSARELAELIAPAERQSSDDPDPVSGLSGSPAE